jgi:hypothetical protein
MLPLKKTAGTKKSFFFQTEISLEEYWKTVVRTRQ